MLRFLALVSFAAVFGRAEDNAIVEDLQASCDAVLAPACPTWKQMNATSKLQCLVSNEALLGGTCYDHIASKFLEENKADKCIQAIDSKPCGRNMTHHHGKVRPVDPLQLLYCALPQKETCGGVCPHVVGRATFRRLKCCVPGGFPCHGDHHKWPRPDDHNKPRPDNHHKWPRPDDHSKWPRPDDDSKWPRPDGDYKPRPDDHHKWPRPDDHNKPRPDAHKHHSDGERHGDRRRRRLSMFMEQRTEENHPHHHHFAPPPCHKCFHHHHHHRNRSHDGDRPRPQELTLIASALQEPLPSTTARMEEPRMPRHHVHGKHHHRRSQDNVQFIMQEFVKLFTLFAIGGFFGRYFTLRKLQQQQQEQVADVTEPLIKA